MGWDGWDAGVENDFNESVPAWKSVYDFVGVLRLDLS